jgi:hypothetical protein
MSEHEEIIESQSEIGEVTVTEYRKNQVIRLAECLVVSPLCIYAGIKYRKQLPAVISIGLVAIGVATLIHSGSNLIKNHNRDGKLIRQAIKQKREEESRVREQKKKEGLAQPLTPPAKETAKAEIKQEPIKAEVQKPAVVPEPKSGADASKNGSSAKPVEDVKTSSKKNRTVSKKIAPKKGGEQNPNA